MAFTELAERVVLDELEPRWRKLGYTIIREPSADDLPDFLKGTKPDAIAVGREPSLFIDVLPRRSSSSETKVAQIQGLFVGRDDWRLEVIYAASEGTPLGPVTSDDIRTALNQARQLAESEPRAGLIMAWATLEAIARLLEPELASRSLSSGSLVDLLISNGHLPQSEGARLRQLGEQRSHITHGQINVMPDTSDIRSLIELEERLNS